MLEIHYCLEVLLRIYAYELINSKNKYKINKIIKKNKITIHISHTQQLIQNKKNLDSPSLASLNG